MRIVVSDSSCLIDLKKASLLGVFLSLPYEILIPNTLFEDELLKFIYGEYFFHNRLGEIDGFGIVLLPVKVLKTPASSSAPVPDAVHRGTPT